MNFSLRPMLGSDVPQVLPLWVELMRFHVAIDPVFEITPDAPAIFSAHLSGLLEGPDFHGLLAESDGEAIGYCLARIAEKPPVFVHRRHGLISDLAVGAEFRESGVGEALFLEARRWFKDKGVDRIELRTVSANVVSNGFWQKMGFSTFAEDKVLIL